MSAPQRRPRGFTLLEMTVVLALVALMSVAMIEGLRFGGRAYQRVVATDDAGWGVFIAQRFLRGVLASAQPFNTAHAGGRAFGLVGSAERLSVTASTSRSKGPGTLNRYDVFVAAAAVNGRRRDLLVSRQLDRDGRPDAEERTPLAQVLIENISRIEWSYLDGCVTPAIWRDNWQGRRDLPALIRARVTFPQRDPRRWPDLIVVPFITDDATFELIETGAGEQHCARSG